MDKDALSNLVNGLKNKLSAVLKSRVHKKMKNISALTGGAHRS